MRSELQRRCATVKRRLFGLDITTFDRPGLLAVLEESMATATRLDVSWLNPYYVQVAAKDDAAVYSNNEAATLAALAAGRDARPSVGDLLSVTRPRNPYFEP